MRIDDQLEIGERVLDFLAFVEPDAADDLVRHRLAHQRILNRPRLRVGAIENRKHPFNVLRSCLLHGAGDEVRLFELVTAAEVDDLSSALAVRPEALVLPVAILLDDRGRRVEDHLRRPVVLFEAHDARLGKVVLEVEDVPEVRSAPLVDRLVRIADDRQVAMDLGEPLDEHVLRTVGVLILVDHHVAELPGVAFPRLRGGLEQLDGLEQQIVEVERVAVREGPEVAFVNAGDLLVAQVERAAKRVGSFHAVLGLADSGERHSRRHQLVVDAELALRLFYHRDLVRRIVDDEIARQPDAGRLTPQQPRAQRVKRREPDSVARTAQHRLDALPHLACGFIGEGDRQHFVRRGVSVADEIRDAIGDDACLSRAGARQNQQRPVDVQHGLTLFGVEIGEERHWRGESV